MYMCVRLCMGNSVLKFPSSSFSVSFQNGERVHERASSLGHFEDDFQHNFHLPSSSEEEN